MESGTAAGGRYMAAGEGAEKAAVARGCTWRDLGRLEYGAAFEMQRGLVERRKRGEIGDQCLIVEHPHTITLGRNGHMGNLLAHEDVLARAGVAFHHTDRGGDITDRKSVV